MAFGGPSGRYALNDATVWSGTPDGPAQALREVIAAGAGPARLAEVRAALDAEREALATDDWTVTDRTYAAVSGDWLWNDGADLRAEQVADPVFRALGTAPALTTAQAAAIDAARTAAATPRTDFLARVRTAIADEEPVVTELVHAAHHLWLQQPEAQRERPAPGVDGGVAQHHGAGA